MFRFAGSAAILLVCLSFPPRCQSEEAPVARSSETLDAKRKAYPDLLTGIETKRRELGERWKKAEAAQKPAILAEARKFLLTKLVEEMFPCWIGTPWNFNGVTETPGQGKIACGYFVTTLLRDAGFRIPRVKLAQEPSQTIIRTMAEPSSIKVSSDKKFPDVLAQLRTSGDGLYVVGLDCHTGFVVVAGEQITFVHASYYNPPLAVVSEPADGHNPFHDSRYRMTGKILGDASIEKWLQGEAIEMKKR